MERFTSFFELHVGFPEHYGEDRTAKFLAKMQQDSPDWSQSIVRSMHLTEPGCLDPHNVPGTLASLVSRKIYSNGSWRDTISRVIGPACGLALEQLHQLGLTDARLEVEFPFACREARMVDGRLIRSAWGEDPTSIEREKLAFSHGCHLDDVPKWEIHYLLEQIPGQTLSRPLEVDEVATFLGRYGLAIEQTIEYQSQSMKAEGRKDFRLIATNYYPTAKHTIKDAERVFYESELCQDAADRGYNTRLILEHIVTCLRPIDPSQPTLLETLDEVNCAS